MECRPHPLFLCFYGNCPLYHPDQYHRRIRLTAKKILGQSWCDCSHADISVHILTQFLWWGAHSLKDYVFVVQFLFIILTLLFLSRRPVKALFDETRTFRFISWHGLLAVLIILISFSWIILSLYWKVHAAWKFGHPFFMDRPQVMTLGKTERSEGLEKYRKIELLNVSLLLPKDFSIGRLHRIERKIKNGRSAYKTRE